MVESLRLRDTVSSDPGLRATAGTGALRQDGFVASLPTPRAAYISAAVVDYDTGRALWDVEVSWLVDSLPNSATPSTGTNIKEAQIRYAWNGYPEFWGDGELLDFYTADKDMLSPIIHNVSNTDSLSNWLYYSLFYQYVDASANVYTRRVSTASVLVPTYHNMSASMWKRIPRYYRSLDTSGHLEQFISVFGWEADYMRSLCDELMYLRDPTRVHYDSLNLLANVSGLPFTAQDLRPHQIRELLSDAARYYARRGRADALIDLFSVITDSEASSREFTTTGATASAYRRIKFTLAAGRANLVTNPRFVGTPSTSGTWNYLTSASAGSITVDHSAATGVTFSTNSSGAGTVYVFPRTAAQIKRKVPYYTSVEASMTNATGKVRLYREEPTNASSLPGQSEYFVTDHSGGTDYYKDLTQPDDDGRFATTAIQQHPGFDVLPSYAETNAVFLTAAGNGTLFHARLYGGPTDVLSDFTLRLTRVDTHPSGSGRFDRFNIAVHDGTVNVIDPQTSSSDTNFTINTAGELINEDTSAAVTKLTQTTGGVDYILLIDNVLPVPFTAYAAATQLPSDDTSSYRFRKTGVEQLFPTIVLTLSNSSSVTLDKWMFEPFSGGAYFDGTALEGNSYVSGGNVVSDYYWKGTANDSVSIYTAMRDRNRASVRKALVHYLPITMTTELTSSNYHTSTNHGHLLTFDAIPGDEQAFDPHSWSAGVYSEGTIHTNSD
jgi:hypothetical protein